MRINIKDTPFMVLEYFLLILVILNCNTPYNSSTDFWLNLGYIIPLVLFFVIIVFGILFGIRKAALNRWGVAFCLYFVAAVCYIAFRVDSNNFFQFVFKFLISLPLFALLGYLEYDRFNNITLLHRYVNLMIFLAATSLFFWIFGTELRLIKPNMAINAFWGTAYRYEGYFGIYFERQYIYLFEKKFLRNEGIFNEAPMYALNLVFAIAVCLFLKNRNHQKKKYCLGKTGLEITCPDWKIVLFSVSILTTFSTTGISMFLAIWVIDYLTKDNRLTLKKTTISVVLVIIAAIIVNILLQDRASSESWDIRMMDYISGLNSWLSSPILGIGYGKTSNIFSTGYLTQQVGYSNSLFLILSQGGILLASLFFGPHLSILVKSKNKQWLKRIKCFSVVVILELIFTIFAYTQLGLMITGLIYSLLMICNEKKNDEEVIICE